MATQELVGTVRAALSAVLRTDSHALARLVYANTTVTFALDGEQDVTLLLDRHPAEIAADDVTGDVIVWLDRAQSKAFALGRLPLTAAIVSGAVATAGPVRQYLEVDPIIRSLLATLAGEDIHHSRATSAATPMTEPPAADLLAIETRELYKAFGPNPVLQGLSLKIPEGVISVILGPSGTGKSVCLNHVLGLLRPDAGDVLIRGRSLANMSRAELLAQRRDIGVMFQDGALFSTMNVHDNVAFPLREHTDFGEADVRELVMDALLSVGLADAGGLMANQLSGGMRKRAGLARALVMNPSIILCDEPDSGLDPVRTALLADLLVERHADHGGTMLVVTHNILLAKAVADHISVIWRGQILEDGMTEQVMASKSAFVQQFLAGDPRGPLSMDA
jgi:ABC-type transporter Mla maintaining outer membrane lipid asymmetry ATPase subunit MlaF